ncbi:two-component system C4-dicarboxylate transport response regulator DctD [Rhizobium rosettiformans]|uniref:sigma-54-dependent transcriptional regulator n=2 Tax=Rhizobium rosettiformans TaxID=1368430 RepID=UPI0028618470|nr:sigma-54 dependent transcriptional regulator [Rhizobium rosettiformans]MDR7031215.1 two-component system C4-dicarboxylate transport response regulator DctD [Rhizobium rosettiformans]MDR7067081.1 two-component system C4-dicarboxylate transport response regulator DctD [Rhizobium rosettiformans]
MVDDDGDHLRAVTDWLTVSGFDVLAFERAEDAFKAVLDQRPDLVLTDLRMPGIDGVTLLNSIKRKAACVPVILLTAHGDVAAAVDAMKRGAEDFIEKPYDADRLVALLTKAVEKGRMSREIDRLQSLVEQQNEADAIIGDGPAMLALKRRVSALAQVDLDVLIIGETGTGKELVARALHNRSGRAAGPFVAINCGALPESIFESEVFGHVKGAFTGALSEREGKFEFADGGTVFLDEIEAMPPVLQAKILRVLQERVVERLGENRLRPVDVRIIAAAKTDLSAEMAAGRFREDLYYRLASVDIRIPALRERVEDIEQLFVHFATLAARRYGQAELRPTAGFLAGLRQEPWRGNVRELKARAERFALGLDADELQPAMSQMQTLALPEQIALYEAQLIASALSKNNGNTAHTAADLGIPVRTLNEKVSRYRLR